MTLDTLPTAAEFGRLVGISRQRAAKLRDSGTLTGDTLAEWIGSYCANLRAQAGARDSGEGPLNLTQQRARLAEAQRLKLEREAKVASVELVPSALVVLEWTDMIGAARAKLLALPSKLANRIAPGNADALSVAKQVVHEALDELSRDGLPRPAPPRRANGS